MTRFAILLAVFIGFAAPALAQDDGLDALFEALQGNETADAATWERIESQIWELWSRSGSDAMDYLLERGREALSADDPAAAIEHLTALVENAPEFAEGFNVRATAYYQAGLIGPALADIGRVLTLEPRHFGALSGLGLILEETGDSEGAIRAYRAALAIHPHRPDLREAIERLEADIQGETI
jgi:tetratricopeptide (TPR) repeat protein